MTPRPSPLLRVSDLRKDHGGLRPLRLGALALQPGARTAIVGLDAPGAEVLVNLITGATLADAGTIEAFGRPTASITNADDWLTTLDRFGVVSVRAVLMDPFTIAQNLAMAFTLSVDPIPAEVMRRVEGLAGETGLSVEDLETTCADARPAVRARCHVARALATGPEILILEHANALVEPSDAEVEGFGRVLARVADARGTAVLALTADERFARAVAREVWRLDAATGRLRPISGWRRWLVSYRFPVVSFQL